MPERETKQFTTPNGHVVTMYTYITGREKREINGVYLEKVELTPGETKASTLKGTLTQDAEIKALSLLIPSIRLDGTEAPITGEGIVDAVLDLPAIDYDAIIREINATTDPKSEETTS